MVVFNTTTLFTLKNYFLIPFKLIMLLSIVSLTACSSLNAPKLSKGIQQAYSVSPTTADRLSPIILQSAKQHDVPPLLVAAVIRQESSYRSNARSPTGALGLMQIIPSHWTQDCPGDLYNEYININCGTHVLATYYKSAGSWHKALGYYYVGPTGYQRSFSNRHKARKYARSFERHKKELKRAL
ncbi:transglycosylase SLT domain protein [Acinetobacter haemolyticus ATCC 19194]|uniref:Transglycosylase SLT domain protein n=1 Tax=Acinetobacter haemolyticus ATCC 19194 TaxID=707232 RepID=D4XLH5_ACIHA|nr:transglycosylase SLT domain-containing protein [Acinetobacter haemolyticus]EFF83942.1 transglycosylase SLT domain protein [Acinetobacter haemolyticus ATCC 19194]